MVLGGLKVESKIYLSSIIIIIIIALAHLARVI